MNGVQTRFKCKLDVKRCKRFVFPPSSLLPRSNALKTKAIRYFQTDRTLTRIVSPPLVNPLKWLSVGGSFIRGTGHAIADSEYTGIKVGENYAKRRWSAGGVVTTSTFNLRTEYLAGKDRNVKSEGFYATGSVRFARNFDFIASFDYFNPNKAADFKQNNYIAGVQYWFYPRCRLQAQYTFCNKKGDGQKDSNLIQAQVQVRF